VYWIEIRSGIDGRTVVPPLLGDWEQASSSLTDTITFGGSPTLVLLCGSQSGTNISYHDNATRRPKLFTPHGQKLIILSTGQNDSGANATYVAAYSTWVTNIKALLPNVPVLCLTQNPVTTPMSNGSAGIRAARGVALMTWAAAQPGIYGLDTYRAFKTASTGLASQLNTDGLHPNPAGSAVWATYVYNQVFADTD
jgi:lysophospholipase L1-like esterase